ncbi:MAG: type IX secretion system membrane protein PorP/SprF [Bacteroidota bacterium]|nr:type IX secretion system membrane protein PorP/SprF [Bacteroidota bacterium]MDP4205050.1 type IX secretion system membrane protein PorP/SprF [Bacteroidota bacterium]
MKQWIVLIFLTITFGQSFGQRDALYSQYMFNQLIINPAYSGSREVLSMTLINRYQWVGIEGSPQTFTFSAHSPLQNDNVSLGLVIASDKIGPTTDFNLMANYTYRVRLYKGKLCFGLQAGLNQINIDWNKIRPEDQSDILYTSLPANTLKPDFNIGTYYYTDHFYIGASARHLFESDYGIAYYDNGTTTYAKLMRHYFFTAGAAIELNKNLVLKPSVLVKYVSDAPVSADFNASVLLLNALWLGSSFRTGQDALVFITEFPITKNMRLGYSYDTYLGKIRPYTKGSHEIMLGFDFDLFKKRMLTPRYF